MPLRDITRRFVVVYNQWPMDSYDDERDALARMGEMRATQLRSLKERWCFDNFDNSSLWSVSDTADDVKTEPAAAVRGSRDRLV